MRKKILIGFGCVLFLVIVLITSPFFKSVKSANNTSQKENKIQYSPASVPELADILGSDQETRLKAGRKLVERVDVEKALEILEHSALPHTGEGHLVVHQIGFYAYKKYGLESILKCRDYFLFACYHGAIIEAASDAGFEQITKMTDRCKESSNRYFQCVHAAGHSILAIWNYDLPKALKTCDELYEKKTSFPEALTSCHNGAFMENLFGVHDWGTTKAPKRDWLSDDMYYPCNAFSEKYQKGCWLNQAARIYQMYDSDLVKTLQTCEKIGNWQYTIWCVDNLARQIHPLTNGDASQAFNLCAQLGPYWRENCIIINAGSFYSVGDSNSAITICQRILDDAKPACFENIIGQIASNLLSQDEKMQLCYEIGGFFENQCRRQIQT